MRRLIVAPNGVAYAPQEARQGVLPRLLSEILATRIMVKAAMKRAPKTAKVLTCHLPPVGSARTPKFKLACCFFPVVEYAVL